MGRSGADLCLTMRITTMMHGPVHINAVDTIRAELVSEYGFGAQ
jgi:hypothetical protein